MSARVSSITHLRARARRRDQISMANSRISVTVLVVVGILTIIGLGATMSASSVEGILEESNHLAIFTRQLRWVGVGSVALLVAMKVPYTLYRKLAFPLLMVSVGCPRCCGNRWSLQGRSDAVDRDRFRNCPAFRVRQVCSGRLSRRDPGSQGGTAQRYPSLCRAGARLHRAGVFDGGPTARSRDVDRDRG